EVEATGRRVVEPKMSAETFASEEVHVWHTHPSGDEAEQFSEGTYMSGGKHHPGYVDPQDPGDYAATQFGAFRNESGRTYMLSPARNLRSIGVDGPMPFGTPHGTVWIPRAAPAAGGMIGGASATPVVRA